MGCGAPTTPGEVLELEVQGRARRAVVHVPSSYDGVTAVPLVVAFPFFGGDPGSLASLTDLDEASEARGVLLVIPEGVGASFNAGKCCGEAWEEQVDDVAFTAALIDEVSSTEASVEAGELRGVAGLRSRWTSRALRDRRRRSPLARRQLSRLFGATSHDLSASAFLLEVLLR